MHAILIIDENREEVYALREFLRDQGFKVYISTKLREGFFKAKEKIPELILVGLDSLNDGGFNFIREVRSDKTLTNVYLVILSNKTDDLSKVLAFELGSDDYVIKPVCRVEVLARIKSKFQHSKKVTSYL